MREKLLLICRNLLYVPGKREQHASILMTQDMEKSLEVILTCRDQFNISQSNKF